MREIEFRIWDSSEGRMYYLTKNRFGFGVDENINVVSWEDVFAEQHEELVPLQYTGLIDKKGNKIFDGDIVQTDEGIRWVEDADYGWALMERENWGDSFQAHVMNTAINQPEITDEVFEVMGNIYQNSDLLGDTQ